MEHSFDIRVAERIGINAAIILKHLYFWISKNRANEKHFHDGRYWTYSSVKAMCELFPYLSKKQISGALEKLESFGLIMVGNYNSTPYDRTRWFSITDFGYELLNAKEEVRKNEKSDSNSPNENSFSQKGKCNNNYSVDNTITDTLPNVETYNYNDEPPKKPKRFVPPTVQAVTEYCLEKNKLHIDPEKFISYYESNGWMVGKNKMKDWKSAITTWERNAIERGERQHLFPKRSEQKQQKQKQDPVVEFISDEEWLAMMERSNNV